jgi:superfamily II RNA helicase
MESKFHISYSKILNLIRNGQTTFGSFCDFVDKSMMSMDLDDASHELEKQQSIRWNAWKQAETQLLPLLHTPIDVMKQYMNIQECLPQLVNKKRKEAERNLQQLIEEHRTCVADVERYKSVNRLEQQWQDINTRIGENQDFVQIQVGEIVQILLDRGFIEGTALDGYQFTAKGHVASQMAETHPLASTDVLFQYNFLENFTPKQLVALLSCFSDVRVPHDVVKHSPTIDNDVRLRQCVIDLKTAMTVYEDMEGECRLNTGIRYTNAVNFDLLDEMMIWVDCRDESACKQFIQGTLAQEKQLSVGDFVKAMLKISAVAKEWMSMCEYEGKIGLMHALQQVDDLILKYVCTTQSLYI